MPLGSTPHTLRVCAASLLAEILLWPTAFYWNIPGLVLGSGVGGGGEGSQTDSAPALPSAPHPVGVLVFSTRGGGGLLKQKLTPQFPE